MSSMDERDEKMGAKQVKTGAEVALAYRLALADGTEVDSASVETPFLFTVGDGSLIEGLENLLVGLTVGEKQAFLIAASDAFGVADPDQLHTLPRGQFDATMALEPGTVIGFESPSGDEVAATVVEADEDSVVVDFNHPLAGRDLQFEVEVLSIDEVGEVSL